MNSQTPADAERAMHQAAVDTAQRFGDHDPDDSYDPSEPPDPYQVAAKFHDVARDLRVLERWPDPGPRFDQLDAGTRDLAAAIAGVVLAWLARQHG